MSFNNAGNADKPEKQNGNQSKLFGKMVEKPEWWFALIDESELHSRIRSIAQRKAKELACFGGR